MKLQKLAATTYQAHCLSCGAASEYVLFHASFYDFETFWGATTRTWYRLNLDLTTARYGTATAEEVLREAAAREGGRDNLRRAPDQLSCPQCGSLGLNPTDVPPATREVEAVSLP